MKTAEQIAQWVIDNRYPKSENNNVSDSEMYHELVESIAKLCTIPCVSNSLPDFRDVIEARIKFFNTNYHTYEGSKLQNALNTIRQLVPPILFQIGQ